MVYGSSFVVCGNGFVVYGSSFVVCGNGFVAYGSSFVVCENELGASENTTQRPGFAVKSRDTPLELVAFGLLRSSSRFESLHRSQGFRASETMGALDPSAARELGASEVRAAELSAREIGEQGLGLVEARPAQRGPAEDRTLERGLHHLVRDGGPVPALRYVGNVANLPHPKDPPADISKECIEKLKKKAGGSTT